MAWLSESDITNFEVFSFFNVLKITGNIIIYSKVIYALKCTDIDDTEIIPKHALREKINGMSYLT